MHSSVLKLGRYQELNSQKHSNGHWKHRPRCDIRLWNTKNNPNQTIGVLKCAELLMGPQEHGLVPITGHTKFEVLVLRDTVRDIVHEMEEARTLQRATAVSFALISGLSKDFDAEACVVTLHVAIRIREPIATENQRLSGTYDPPPLPKVRPHRASCKGGIDLSADNIRINSSETGVKLVPHSVSVFEILPYLSQAPRANY
jgi:hypothetical protein